MSDWSAGQPPRGWRPQAQGRGYDYYGGRNAGGPPPTRRAPEPPGGGGEYRSPSSGLAPRPRRRWGRRIGITLVVVLLVLVGLVFYFDSTLQRVPALDGLQGPTTAGTNWLLIGSDSREGMDPAEAQRLGAGDSSDVSGARTDTMMLMHIPAGGGQAALISLPRDSYVPIPGHGKDKLNAAYSEGGAPLLAQTVQNTTGVHIDHYAEIGLVGFASMVDDVGGVNMCIDQPMQDPKANLNLQPGCQELNGPQALGFVRSRNFPLGDLQRIADQRKLLSALVQQTTSPATLFNPFRLFPLVSSATKTFKVNTGDHIWDLASLGWSMDSITNGKGVTASVPFRGFGQDSQGQSVLLWDQNGATRMFNAIAQDQPIPQDLLSK
jgi:LCP family protein required for cell wall assembly